MDDWSGFNPRSPRGGATNLIAVSLCGLCFNPRSPRGGATSCLHLYLSLHERFNPRSPRGGATVYSVLKDYYLCVSIHAPREGERHPIIPVQSRRAIVSIHAPREGERLLEVVVFRQSRGFNPRSPRGGATPPQLDNAQSSKFQSTLPARGSDSPAAWANYIESVSIHAPREGERHFSGGYQIQHFRAFQSTLPARGSDNFRPGIFSLEMSFQSTLPARGSDGNVTGCRQAQCVSIHAPREGERLSLEEHVTPLPGGFNPRSPRGGATVMICH